MNTPRGWGRTLALPLRSLTLRSWGQIARTAVLMGLALAGADFLAIRQHQTLAAVDQKNGQPCDNPSSSGGHFDVRSFAIWSQLEQTTVHDTIVLAGDSIVELAFAPALCGKATFNAGIGGATVSDVSRRVLSSLQEKKPGALIIAVGVNDARRSSPLTREQRIEAFTSDYRELVANAKALTRRLAVVLVAPVERSKLMGDLHFDPAMIDTFDAIIRTIAANEGVQVIAMPGLSDGHGYAREGLTIDGVHLTADGYVLWRDAIQKGCATLMQP